MSKMLQVAAAMGSSASLRNDTSRITPRVTSSAVRRVGERNELVTPAKNSDTASSTVASVYWSPTWPAWSPALESASA